MPKTPVPDAVYPGLFFVGVPRIRQEAAFPLL